MGEHFDSEPDPAIQARVAEILTEIAEGIRWQPAESPSPASSEDPERHVLEVLEPEERKLWNRVPAAARAKLAREFRGGITANGLGYLRKKIALLAPPAPDDQGGEPAAGSSSADGKEV